MDTLGVTDVCRTPEQRASPVFQAFEHGNYLRLMYVCQFLTEVGVDIPELVLKCNYDQLVGYTRDLLDQ